MPSLSGDLSSERPMESETALKGRLSDHRILSEHELIIFRTKLCEAQCNGSCADPDRCSHSHCLTWQRRNPMRVLYSPTLCPDIEFVRRNARMALLRRCNRGRGCPYAHSKEEELYHPMVYKTKMCKVYPNCRRYHCPFAHTPDELRRRMTAEEYRAAKVAASASSDATPCWSARNRHVPAANKCTSPLSHNIASNITTEASSVGHHHPSDYQARSPVSAGMVRMPGMGLGHGHQGHSPRSSPYPYQGPPPMYSLNHQQPHRYISPPTSYPYEPYGAAAPGYTQDDLVRNLASLITQINQLHLNSDDRCPPQVQIQDDMQSQERDPGLLEALSTSLDMPSNATTDTTTCTAGQSSEDEFDYLWQDIANNLLSTSIVAHQPQPSQEGVQPKPEIMMRSMDSTSGSSSGSNPTASFQVEYQS